MGLSSNKFRKIIENYVFSFKKTKKYDGSFIFSVKHVNNMLIIVGPTIFYFRNL